MFKLPVNGSQPQWNRGSGLAAILYAKGQLLSNRAIQLESVLGTTFQVEAADKTKFCVLDAIVP